MRIAELIFPIHNRCKYSTNYHNIAIFLDYPLYLIHYAPRIKVTDIPVVLEILAHLSVFATFQISL